MKIADAWDPARDKTSGNQCKAYGAAAILRMPGRLHIAWQDDNALKLETDAGTQTRLFYFGAPQSQGGDWQGVSIATWDRPGSPMGFSLGLGPRDFAELIHSIRSRRGGGQPIRRPLEKNIFHQLSRDFLHRHPAFAPRRDLGP